MRQIHNAFTLIELLVVISIIALLIAILLPTLSKARFTAEMAQCLSNHHQMAVGANTLATDNRGRFTHHNVNNLEPGKQIAWYLWPNSPKTTRWLGYYGPTVYTLGAGSLFELGYVTDPNAYYCPSDEYYNPDPTGYDGFHSEFSLAYMSYTWNPMGKVDIEDSFSLRGTGGDPQTLIGIQPFDQKNYNPSTAILMNDAMQGYQSVGGNAGNGSTHRPYWNIARFDGSAERSPASQDIQARHDQGIDPFDDGSFGWTEHDRFVRALMGDDDAFN